MKKRAVFITGTVAALVLSVGGVAGTYAYNTRSLEHGPAYVAPEPRSGVDPLLPAQGVDNAALGEQLRAAGAALSSDSGMATGASVDTAAGVSVGDASGEAPGQPASLRTAPLTGLATFGARVIDLDTGEIVFEEQATRPLVPASSTKLLTAAAALLQLGERDTITTRVLAGPEPDSVVLAGSGDVWLSEERLDELVAELAMREHPVHTVYLDTSLWSGPTFLPGWDKEDVAAGDIAPMEPLMLNKAMLTGEERAEAEGEGAAESAAGEENPSTESLEATPAGYLRSLTPAFDVARALAQRLGAKAAPLESPLPDATEVLATSQSSALGSRLQDMMENSDNVAAEAIGREIAVARGLPGSAEGATEAILTVLREAGFPVADIALFDASGLSTDNRITPLLLSEVLRGVSDDPRLRLLAPSFPVAGGSGTLASRYGELSGRGWVRAKTGTLTGVSALAGIVPGRNGHDYAFAFLSNDGQVAQQRAAIDRLASIIRDF